MKSGRIREHASWRCQDSESVQLGAICIEDKNAIIDRRLWAKGLSRMVAQEIAVTTTCSSIASPEASPLEAIYHTIVSDRGRYRSVS